MSEHLELKRAAVEQPRLAGKGASVVAPKDLRDPVSPPGPLRLHDYRSLENLVFVFSMGKVASTALCRSMEAKGLVAPHCQWLSEANQEFMRQVAGAGAYEIDLALTLLQYERFRAGLADRSYARLVKVVTCVREPLSQILSQYFHRFSTFAPYIEADYGAVTAETVCAHLKALAQNFLSLGDLDVASLTRAAKTGGRIDQVMFAWMTRNALHWFDEELLPFFDIDVYARPFDRYCLMGNVLVLKFEGLADDGERLLKAFVQRPNLRLARTNTAAERPEGPLYDLVRRARPFPDDFARVIHASRYARHFYGLEELEAAASNLARTQSVRASSVFTDDDTQITHTPSNVLSDRPELYWHSDAGLPQWIEVDSREPRPVARLCLQVQAYEGAMVRQFRLLGADGGTEWSELLKGEHPNSLDLVAYDLPQPAVFMRYRVEVVSTWRAAPYAAIQRLYLDPPEEGAEPGTSQAKQEKPVQSAGLLID